MNVSLAWTWPAFVAGEKTCTRRGWVDSYALRFKHGSEHTVSDKDFRWGGEKIGVIRLIADPVKQSTMEMPRKDYRREGFAFLNDHRYLIPKSSPFALVDDMYTEFQDWRERDEFLWTVRFEPVEIFKPARARLDALMRNYAY
jgi:hypothetical protein